MTVINPDLERQLRAEPHKMVDLIVRMSGEVNPRLAWFQTANIQVKQQFRLVPGVAVACSGQAALQLLTQSWVLSIEPDAPVSTMPPADYQI